jgi:hypothetical protein
VKTEVEAVKFFTIVGFERTVSLVLNLGTTTSYATVSAQNLAFKKGA